MTALREASSLGSSGTVWDSLVGQRHVIETLRAAAAGKGMTQSWLFVGPPGSGRSNAAIAFAAALQCPQGGCGTCHACHTVLASSHADVKLVRTEKLTLGVDDVRDLVRTSALSPDCDVMRIVLPPVFNGWPSCSDSGTAIASMPSAR